MKAVILAGGKGTRLKPYTILIPKPLVPVGEKAILEILIERLKSNGITEFILCVNHFADLIMAYFGDGRKWGVHIEYSIEDKPLGTIAPLKQVRNLPDDFLVTNGDVLTDLSFRQFHEYHLLHQAVLTVAVHKRKQRIDYGVIQSDDTDNVAVGFSEKPELDLNVSMGVYGLNKRVLDTVPDDAPFGFDDLVMTLLGSKQTVKLYPHTGYWLDIGRPDDYERANQDIEVRGSAPQPHDGLESPARRP